jgi:hypothetical protein
MSYLYDELCLGLFCAFDSLIDKTSLKQLSILDTGKTTCNGGIQLDSDSRHPG